MTLKAIMKRPPSTKFEAFLGYYEGRQLVLKLELTNENLARPRIWATIYNSENVREALRLHLLMDRISRRLILKHSVPKLVPVLNWGKAAVCCVECPGTFFRSSAKRQKTGVICPPPVPLVVVCLVCEYVGSDLQHSEELLKVQADWRENGLITEDSRALMRSILHSAHAMHTMGRTAIMDASFSNMYPITKKTTMSYLQHVPNYQEDNDELSEQCPSRSNAAHGGDRVSRLWRSCDIHTSDKADGRGGWRCVGAKEYNCRREGCCRRHKPLQCASDSRSEAVGHQTAAQSRRLSSWPFYAPLDNARAS